MKKLSIFLYSQILGKKVFDEFEDNIGVIRDVYVTTQDGYPRIIGYKLKKDGAYFDYEFKNIEFLFLDNNSIRINVKGAREIIAQKYSYLLSHHLLDRKIVDINGKKVVRVNDLRIAEIGGEYKVLAVESGRLASFRRFRLEKLAKFFFKLTNKDYKDSVIMWDDVASLEMVNDNLKLAISYQKLSKLHPADLADILEELDSKYRNKIFESLDENLAAETLEEIEPEFQESIIKELSDMKTVEVFDNMPNDEIADILEDLDEETAEKILMNLENEDAKEIRELMSYKEETVGSIMNKDFISFNIDITIQETIDLVRELDPDDEVMYYIYITDEEEKLRGVVSLKSLIMYSGDTKLSDIMDSSIVKVNVADMVEENIEVFTKYDLISLPVVDDNNKLVGIVIIHDLIEEFLLPSWKKRFKKAV